MNDYTEIVVIVDKSGSMHSFAKDTIGGYNAFLEDQKKIPGDARLTTVIFNTDMEIFEDGVDLQKAIPLTSMNYVPSGNTALLDAMHLAITKVRDRQEALPEYDRTNRVLVMTVTDGQENASTQHTKNDIKKLVEELTPMGWRFDFLSVDMNAIDDAVNHYGIAASNTRAFANTQKGYVGNYAMMSHSTTLFRQGNDTSNDADADKTV
jgi:uncharacterized protein YegL